MMIDELVAGRQRWFIVLTGDSAGSYPLRHRNVSLAVTYMVLRMLKTGCLTG